ncbi:MAG: DUF255 domain-containing protein [Planctomycetota bacterium]
MSTADASPADPPRFTNALIHETSPYLRQHAHNPVDWRPWGDDVFAEAARRGVPVFLSIGYATCYWCHVMERQVFEDPAIAAPLNQRFVCIKVDREERPEVDELYMTAAQLMTGSGGWPLNLFLTPPEVSQSDGDEVAGTGRGLLPFWAGTYIPPTPAYGRPSFPQVVEALGGAWAERPGEVIEQGQRVAEAVARQLAGADAPPGAVTRGDVLEVADRLRGQYDPEHGGFSGTSGGGPKFPTPSVPALLLDVYADDPDAHAGLGDALRHTLDRMARGGMFDQVGGGFHRYSVDEKWLVPHFEKMLYDQGQLLSLYARSAEVWAEERGFSAMCRRVARETAEYLLREMVDGTGAFWSAQDAEVNTREGENYVWTPQQVAEALRDEPDGEALTALAVEMYGLDRGPNFRDPHHDDAPPTNVLHLPEPLSELVEAHAPGDMGGLMAMRRRINDTLYAARQKRDQPITDDKVLTGWNGLAIEGLAEAGRVLDESRFVDAAGAAADAVLSRLSRPDGGLFRTMRDGEAKIDATLEDYAFFVGGLLALPEDGGRWLREAVRLTDHTLMHFGRENGGYHDTLAGRPDLFVRPRSTYDGAVPAASSQMLHNLVALHGRTGEPRWIERAVRDLRAEGRGMANRGVAMTHRLRAAWRLLRGDAAWAGRLAAGDEPAGVDDAVTWTADPVDDDTLILTLAIAEGLHLNANPASAAGLVPTSVSAAGGAIDVSYPPGVTKRYPLADAPLAVYEGWVELEVRGVAGLDELTLTYQACTETACREPVTRRVTW